MDAVFGPPFISTPIDCLLGLALVASVGLAAWTVWRSRDP